MRIALVFLFAAFVLSPAPLRADTEKDAADKWRKYITDEHRKAARIDDMSLDQIKDALGALDDAQRTADMELMHQESVLEKLTKEIQKIKELYAETKIERETPANVFGDGVEFSVTDFEDDIKADYDWQQPKSGFQYLSIFVEVANKGRKTPYVASSYFVVKDEKGQMFSRCVSRTEPDLKSMTLEPGDRVSGWITYEIPWNDYKESLRIKFDGGRFGSSRWVPVWQ